jgi:oxaloacetate decarboxylase alpha subunit/pyruvate carboxylase subunit B
MSRRLLIRDVTMRDGQQSLFATRMSQGQVDRLLPLYREAGFYALEVWGGAVPDSIMRFLNEDPWVRLEKIRKGIGTASHLTALSRGRNLFGYNPYPESVIEGFNRNAILSGISIMRIFDALNDTRNIASTIRYVHENGGLADCVVCYTVDPRFSKKERLQAFLKGKKLPEDIFTTEYFVNMAVELESMGADMVTIKDMAGLISPDKAGELVSAFKNKIKVPVDFHTHCTPGYGLSSALMAIASGVDILDTAIMNFAGGPAAPAFELIQLFCNRMDIETGVNLPVVAAINNRLMEIRLEMSDIDSYHQYPIEFNIATDILPEEIGKLFDEAIDCAQTGKTGRLQEICLKIERYFNFPEPDEKVKDAEIPGGMYTNMLSQLKQLNQEHLLPKVLEVIPTVRLAAGCPPLVTPTSQIVGAQAVNCVTDASNGNPFFTNNSNQFVNLVKGSYGKTPIPIDPEFRLKIAGTREETPFNTDGYEKQPNPEIPELGAGRKLASTEKEELLLELFPNVAVKFLNDRAQRAISEQRLAEQREKQRKYEEAQAQFLAMTPEEKYNRLLKGIALYC